MSSAAGRMKPAHRFGPFLRNAHPPSFVTGPHHTTTQQRLVSQRLANIALPLPLPQVFTYLIPPDLEALVRVGCRVAVPFGTKVLTGVVVDLPVSSTVKGLKPIRDVLDLTPGYSAEMLGLTAWIAEYYLASQGEVLKAAAPQGSFAESKLTVRLIASDIDRILEETKRTAPRQHELLRVLSKSSPLTAGRLQKVTGVRSIHALLRDLERKGWVRIEQQLDRPKGRPKKEKFLRPGTSAVPEKVSRQQSAVLTALAAETNKGNAEVALAPFLMKNALSLSAVKTLAKRNAVAIDERVVVRTSGPEQLEPPPQLTLNRHQQAAFDEIAGSLATGTYATFLLHGVTGSGKTQVYIEAIRRVLKLGKSAIVLVPEISLTPQTVRRFKAHFGGDVAVMHSQMSTGERYDAWRQAHEGKVRIVIGPRSAVFAPLTNIGLVVVDEEHESSYKQYDATPRYHARDVAIVRARMNQAVVVLGSATPSAESYYNAASGKYRLLALPERADNARMPVVEVIDMAGERRRQYDQIKQDVKLSKKEFPKRLPNRSVSDLLRDQIAARLAKKEGTILLQNRRGFSHVLECFECGFVERCGNCDVSLTYHATRKHLRCHYCGFVKKAPTVCPTCQSTEIRYFAFGTQQVQEELATLFPEARVLRMDRDTTTRRGAHDRILGQFARGEADILLGTQMVAKGLDFPRVTLVGVISADTQMLLPDFRASEQTFQLLTQVAGRSGRSNLAGEVVIQTLQPDHYSLKHVVAHDFEGFYREEIEYRRELDYPPFSRIVQVEFTGLDEAEVGRHAQSFAGFLDAGNHAAWYTVLGPADAAIPKINNRYRKHVIIKNFKANDPSGTQARRALLKARSEYGRSFGPNRRAVTMSIDVDPHGMM